MRLPVHSPLRFVAALLALAWAAAPLASLLHAEEHAHIYCAEHRAIEESRSKVEREGGSAARELTAAPTPDDSHQGCALLALGARSALPVGDALALELEAPTLPPERPQLAVQHSPVPLLAAAPKSSPPRA